MLETGFDELFALTADNCVPIWVNTDREAPITWASCRSMPDRSDGRAQLPAPVPARGSDALQVVTRRRLVQTIETFCVSAPSAGS